MSKSSSKRQQADLELMKLAIAGDNTAFASICKRSIPALDKFLREQCAIWGENITQVESLRNQTISRFLEYIKCDCDAGNGEVEDPDACIKQRAIEVLRNTFSDSRIDKAMLELMMPLRRVVIAEEIETVVCVVRKGQTTEYVASILKVEEGEIQTHLMQGLIKIRDYLHELKVIFG